MKRHRNTLTPLGRQVKKRLIDIGMTHAELCEACGCGQTYMSDILAGRRSGEKYVPYICKVLKLPEPEGMKRAQ